MLKDIRSNARFILIIEKDATFQKVLEENDNLPPHILITVFFYYTFLVKVFSSNMTT